MIIELQPAWTPTSSATESSERCALCRHPLEDLSVIAYATTDDGAHAGVACFQCVSYLGRRNLERFPTEEEYRALLERHPSPMYPDMESLERAGEEAGYVALAPRRRAMHQRRRFI